jgi:hypothetical protein
VLPSVISNVVQSLSPETRALVAATWSFRTLAERESSLRFKRLADSLAQTGALPIVIDMARSAAREEHRHSQLCAAMCSRYGGKPPTSVAHDHPAVWPGLTGRDALLYEIVAFCCVAETINAQLLVTTLQQATDDRVVRVVRRLLRDEISHGRLGWAHLASERKQGAGGFLPQVLRSVSRDLFEDTPEIVTPQAVAHGELPRATRLDIFRSMLRDVLLPGFDSVGIDTTATRRWTQERFPVA